MDSEKNKEIVRQVVEEVWSGDLGLVPDLIAPNYHVQSDPGDPWDGKTLSHAEFIVRLNSSLTAFPDIKFEIQTIVGEGERVAVSWFLTGTNLGPIHNLPATKRKLRVPGLTIYTVREGLVCGHWQVVDRVTAMEQLGFGTSG